MFSNWMLSSWFSCWHGSRCFAWANLMYKHDSPSALKNAPLVAWRKFQCLESIRDENSTKNILSFCWSTLCPIFLACFAVFTLWASSKRSRISLGSCLKNLWCHMRLHVVQNEKLPLSSWRRAKYNVKSTRVMSFSSQNDIVTKNIFHKNNIFCAWTFK